MRPRATRPIAAALLAMTISACSGGATTTPSLQAPTQPAPSVEAASPSVEASTAPSPTPSLPPASATVNLSGALSGAMQGITISCNEPGIKTMYISLFGSAPVKDMSLAMNLSVGLVAVTVDAGSGATYTARSFTGTGVTGFDAAKGAQFDSTLTEVLPSGSNPGTLPAITSIKGTVDCGNQVPGSSTLTLTGSVPDGAFSGPIDPIRVDCNPNAKPATVHAVGVIHIGANPTVIVFQATAAGFTAFVVPTATTKQHFYVTTDPTAATISPTGAHVSGSAAESGTPNMLQVSGDLVCGVVNP